MRIGILGQPCIDEIVHLDDRHNQEARQAVGGILYSFAAMERLMREAAGGDQFVPLTWLSEPDRHILESTLNSFRHMDRASGLWPNALPTNRVFLVYDETGERTATCPNVLPQLTLNELTPALLSSLDAMIVNMISGHDVSLDTVEAALAGAERLGQRPYVHLDVHALVMADLSALDSPSHFGYNHDPRGVRDWRRWLQLIDSIQLNEEEARWFGDPDVASEDALLGYVQQHRESLRTGSIIITRAENGATLYDARDDTVHHVPIPSHPVIEPTGSGDVFGAAYTYAMARGTSPLQAAQQAVDWATWNATLLTLGELLTAKR